MKSFLIEDCQGDAGQDVEEDHGGHHADRRVHCRQPQTGGVRKYQYGTVLREREVLKQFKNDP